MKKGEKVTFDGEYLSVTIEVYNFGKKMKDFHFNVSDGITLHEKIGVRGGHIDWSLSTNNKSISFGRKHEDVMIKCKKILEKKVDGYKYEATKNVASPGY